jgi:drug/metabolite transporter (DMT)-like permease
MQAFWCGGYLSTMTKFLVSFSFALFAALGNVFFVLGSRKSGPSSNPLTFTAGAMAVSLTLFTVGWLLFGPRGSLEFARRSGGWIALSGLGMFMTFLGFYLLYSRFGTSYYTLFVMTSMILTTLVLSLWILREGINVYGVLSIIAATVSIAFFGLSKR